ncbi:MAG: hypothetical protein FJW27_04625 [Acidimicrobiia bacterium]|nr:hypothetical protein [Acidimicrobiia bacterium]
MTRRTRRFVVASLLVLGVGVGTGLLAYLSFPTSAFTGPGGPDELRYLPGNAHMIAFVDVHHVMISELRQRLRATMPFTDGGARRFQDETGVNIETDIDRVVFAVAQSLDGSQTGQDAALAVVRGRFDAVRIEASLREKGASVEWYKGRSIFGAPDRDAATDATSRDRGSELAIAFIEPGLIAAGSPSLVRSAIDRQDGGASARGNDALMKRVRELEPANLWAVGRFDALTARANFQKGAVGPLPAMTWFAASGQVDSGIRASVTAEGRDEEAANALRDLVRGFFALAKLRGSSQPALGSLLRAVQLGGTGQTVTLSIDFSPQMLDALTGSLSQLPRVARPRRGL